MTVPISNVYDYFLDLQARIVQALEDAGGTPFQSDQWTRAEGGGGLSRYLEGGSLFERAGVLFSHVQGKTLPPSASAHRKELAGPIGRASCRERESQDVSTLGVAGTFKKK